MTLSVIRSDVEDVFELAVEPVGPDVMDGLGFDQLPVMRTSALSLRPSST